MESADLNLLNRLVLVEATLDSLDPKASIQPWIADKAYDSRSLGEQLADQQIELMAPHRNNRKKTKTQDGHPL